MNRLPDRVAPYRRTPNFDESTIPEGLLKDHRTKAGVWGVIHVLSGELRYRDAETGRETVLTPGTPGVVEPQARHSVAPRGAVSFYIEFWR